MALNLGRRDIRGDGSPGTVTDICLAIVALGEWKVVMLNTPLRPPLPLIASNIRFREYSLRGSLSLPKLGDPVQACMRMRMMSRLPCSSLHDT